MIQRYTFLLRAKMIPYFILNSKEKNQSTYQSFIKAHIIWITVMRQWQKIRFDKQKKHRNTHRHNKFLGKYATSEFMMKLFAACNCKNIYYLEVGLLKF